jgi:hypothetical protein
VSTSRLAKHGRGNLVRLLDTTLTGQDVAAHTLGVGMRRGECCD